MSDSTPCTLDIAFRPYERADRDGCVFLLHRAADGRRLAKGRFLPDGSLEMRDGAAPDKPTMAALTEAALAFQKAEKKTKAADACKAAFAKALEPRPEPKPAAKPRAESKPRPQPPKADAES